MTQLMVLAAGFGTRLRPLTDELPKPLVPVGDRPQLAWILERGRELGFTRPLVNGHFGLSAMRAFSAENPGAMRLIEEPDLLGTAGGVAAARADLSAPTLVWNADLRWAPRTALVEAAFAAPDPCLFVARGKPSDSLCVSPAGTVGLDSRGCVVRLRGERFGEEVTAGDYIGMLSLPRVALDGLPGVGCLVGDFLLPWLRAGKRVASVMVDEPWFDIGAPESYLAANRAWLADRQDYVGSGARVAAGVQLRSTVVGDGATVEGAGLVENCVLWPGSRAVAPLVNTIVTPARTLTVNAPARSGTGA